MAIAYEIMRTLAGVESDYGYWLYFDKGLYGVYSASIHTFEPVSSVPASIHQSVDCADSVGENDLWHGAQVVK